MDNSDEILFKSFQNKSTSHGRLMKTLWEMRKMLVTSIFSFSRNISLPIACLWMLNDIFSLLYPGSMKTLENIVGKEKLLVTSIYPVLFSQQHFLAHGMPLEIIRLFFLVLESMKAFENIVKKIKILVTSFYSFSNNISLPIECLSNFMIIFNDI